jgi:hypothetical protein
MTGGRFEPYGVADAYGQGEPDERTENWERSGTWEQAETWDYDEAHASSEAYNLLESRIMREQEQRPQFARFEAAIAGAPRVTGDLEMRSRVRPPAAASWFETVRTGRLWASALWLVGAAGAGVLAGLVSTNLVALALNPTASSVLAEQTAAPSGPSRSTLSALAPSSMTAPAQGMARPASDGDLAPTLPEVAAGGVASRTVQIAQITTAQAEPVAPRPATEAEMTAPPAEAVPATPQADPTRAAEATRVLAGDARPDATPPPASSALQLAALVEPAPGVPTATNSGPVDRSAPPAMRAAKVPADQADRERAPSPPPAASDTPVTTPLPAAAVPAPTAKYRVQLALLRDEQNVKYVWHDFVAQFGPSAKDFHRYVFPIKTAHGIRQLVQVGPFEDQDHAEAMCAKLKQRGGDCFVVRRPS